MGKAYTDFRRLHCFDQQGAYFVMRSKQNLDYRRRESRPVDKQVGLRSDQIIMLAGVKTAALYPTPLRRIHYYGAVGDKRSFF